ARLITMVTRRDLFAGSLAAVAWAGVSRAFAQSANPVDLTLAEASRMIRARQLSPVEITEAYLAAIDRLEPQVNAYVTVTAERAQFTRRLEAGGAVLLGKLNIHGYAYGGTSSITRCGPVHNPWNLDHIPGGSSGASAAAVAARMCAGAFGTDTLASIRLPAAYCGIVGLKPTHGLASIRGIIPVSESLDHVGPMTRTVGDAALMLGVIAGFDPLDPVSLDAQIPDYASALYRRAATLRIGLAGDRYFSDLEPDVDAAIDEALVVLRNLTAGTRDVRLPTPPDFAVLLAEAYAYHKPYLDNPATRRLYDPVTLERLLAAGEFSTVEYYAARRELALVRNAIDNVFTSVDLVVTPTAPGLPETIANAQNPAEASG